MQTIWSSLFAKLEHCASTTTTSLYFPAASCSRAAAWAGGVGGGPDRQAVIKRTKRTVTTETQRHRDLGERMRGIILLLASLRSLRVLCVSVVNRFLGICIAVIG